MGNTAMCKCVLYTLLCARCVNVQFQQQIIGLQVNSDLSTLKLEFPHGSVHLWYHIDAVWVLGLELMEVYHHSSTNSFDAVESILDTLQV